MGTKEAKSGTKAIAAQRDSAAYGTEVEYKQVGVGIVLSSRQDESDEGEESCEEEYEEELTEEMNAPIPEEDSEERLSRRTSFSSFYVIDEAEEARLKAIAFERLIAE